MIHKKLELFIQCNKILYGEFSMIILQKKKILLCIGLVMVSLLVTGTYQIRNDERTVQTVSLPVSNKVIVLDARAWSTR